ncbi:venom protease-like [Periplaneta americana]|uniref:venom protease-like n=1 Tax=Periplaneta americana TaxID=6978 RepID=UPI0037E8B022
MAARFHVILFLLVLTVAANSRRFPRAGVEFVEANGCTNPRGQPGQCINIKQCPQLINMLRQQRQTPGVADFLRASACGYEGNDPKVCCPRTDTRNSGSPPPQTSSAAPNRETVELPSGSECGIVPPFVDERRIVGGYPAKLGAWPWLAALGYRSSPSSDLKYLCGGALITKRHIITAGHCVYNRRDLTLARLGDLDLKNDSDGASPINVPIEDRMVHEDYNPTTFVNDIAIIRLNQDVDFTPMIHPICLPLQPEIRSRDFTRHFPYIAGWGSVQFNGPSSSHLLQLQLPVVSENECKNAFKTFKTAHIDNRVLCAGFMKGGKDACQGDSGGPLMWPKGETFYLIGVVSYGFKCAEPGYPGVYTKVPVFLDWITTHLI